MEDQTRETKGTDRKTKKRGKSKDGGCKIKSPSERKRDLRRQKQTKSGIRTKFQRVEEYKETLLILKRIVN